MRVGRLLPYEYHRLVIVLDCFGRVEIEDRAAKEADQRVSPDSPNYVQELSRVQEELHEKYLAALLRKYSITRGQSTAIGVEGIQKLWPKPSLD